jgi:hypothetical protein
LGVILTGIGAEAPSERLEIAFAAHAPQGLPGSLGDMRIEKLAARRYRLSSGPREWIVEGAAHVHRDLTGQFATALPARAVPWRKRLFWRVLLALAASRVARGLLLRTRG